jgi:hypothetical protein
MASALSLRSRTSAHDDTKEKEGAPDVEVHSVEPADDAGLELLGYKQEFKRDFTFLGLFSLVSSELAVLPGVAGTIWCAYSMLHER